MVRISVMVTGTSSLGLVLALGYLRIRVSVSVRGTFGLPITAARARAVFPD